MGSFDLLCAEASRGSEAGCASFNRVRDIELAMFLVRIETTPGGEVLPGGQVHETLRIRTYNDEGSRHSDKMFERASSSFSRDSGWGEDGEEGFADHSSASSPRPSRPSDGGEGVVAAPPCWID